MEGWIVDAALTIVPELGLRVSTHTQTGVVLWTRGGCATSHVWALNRDNVCWPALVAWWAPLWVWHNEASGRCML